MLKTVALQIQQALRHKENQCEYNQSVRQAADNAATHRVSFGTHPVARPVQRRAARQRERKGEDE